MILKEKDETLTIELEGTELFEVKVDDVQKYSISNTASFTIQITLRVDKVLN